MKNGHENNEFAAEPGGGESRLSQALSHLRAEPVPVDSLRRALARAERLGATDVKRDAGKSTSVRKPRLSGFDQLEDRRTLSAAGWDGAAFDPAEFQPTEVVAVVTTEPTRPVMSSYSTQHVDTRDFDRAAPWSQYRATEPLLTSHVRVAGIEFDFDHLEEDPAWEELLGTLVSGAV